MDGALVYVAAVVKQTSKNRFYLHEVVDSNGNIIKIGRGESANPTSLATNGDAGTQSPLLDPIIHQGESDVKLFDHVAAGLAMPDAATETAAQRSGPMSREALAEQIMSRALPLPQGSGDGQMERVIREGVQKGLTKLATTPEGKLALFNLALWKGDGFGKAFDEAITDWVVWSTPDSPTQGSDQLADALYTTLVDYFQNKLGKEADARQAGSSLDQLDLESDFGDKMRRGIKSAISARKIVGFDGLSESYRQGFLDSMQTAVPEIKALLEKECKEADYYVSRGRRSYYRGMGDVIRISRDSSASTLAHELFHRIDVREKISQGLFDALMQDYIALNVAGGDDVKGYLVQLYPEAFSGMSQKDEITMGEAYRGIADILNGLSGGTIDYGYGHPKSYWKSIGALEAEAWAQFGRVLYENSPEVLKMFEELLPNFLRNAILALKGLI